MGGPHNISHSRTCCTTTGEIFLLHECRAVFRKELWGGGGNLSFSEQREWRSPHLQVQASSKLWNFRNFRASVSTLNFNKVNDDLDSILDIWDRKPHHGIINHFFVSTLCVHVTIRFHWLMNLRGKQQQSHSSNAYIHTIIYTRTKDN